MARASRSGRDRGGNEHSRKLDNSYNQVNSSEFLRPGKIIFSMVQPNNCQPCSQPTLHSVVDEVIMLAEITASLRDRVMSALRAPDCENCPVSALGVCATHRRGVGVYNMRVLPPSNNIEDQQSNYPDPRRG